MKKYIIVLLITICCLSSCVQKAKKQTVTLLLDVSAMKDIKTVGVRGSDKPLSWDYDTELKTVKKDSLYEITITGETGRLCSEIKFTVNSNFELQDKENRKVYFDKSGKTVYKARFNETK
jgi:hypothetical protein